MVDVTEEEDVDGLVPGARVLIPGSGVPPVRVETAVGEVGEFCQQIQKTLK